MSTDCIKAFLGDGGCDDEFNTELCKFDDGDCCLPLIDKTLCIACFCHETNREHGEIPETAGE
jgi:hypothetical protein